MSYSEINRDDEVHLHRIVKDVEDYDGNIFTKISYELYFGSEYINEFESDDLVNILDCIINEDRRILSESNQE